MSLETPTAPAAPAAGFPRPAWRVSFFPGTTPPVVIVRRVLVLSLREAEGLALLQWSLGPSPSQTMTDYAPIAELASSQAKALAKIAAHLDEQGGLAMHPRPKKTAPAPTTN